MLQLLFLPADLRSPGNMCLFLKRYKLLDINATYTDTAAVKVTVCHPLLGNHAGDVFVLQEEGPLWEDGAEVQRLSCSCSSRVPTETD